MILATTENFAGNSCPRYNGNTLNGYHVLPRKETNRYTVVKIFALGAACTKHIMCRGSKRHAFQKANLIRLRCIGNEIAVFIPLMMCLTI